MWKRIRAAWRALHGQNELDHRLVTFGIAAMEHLEASPQWGLDTCRVIAQEAIARKLGSIVDGEFAYTVDTAVAMRRTEPYKFVQGGES